MRNWKGLSLGYDEIIVSPASEQGCCYCLRDNEVEALLALIQPLEWRTRWYSETGADIELSEIVKFKERLERKLMDDCCSGNSEIVLTRINPTTNVIEISVDGGVTWTESPNNPGNLVIQLPPITPTDPDNTRCEAAANLRQHAVDMVAEHTANYDTASTALDFIAAFALFCASLIFAPEAVPFIIPLLIGAATAAFAIGKSAWEAYWVSAEFDKIECAYFCACEDDGTLTENGFNRFLVLIGHDLTAGVQRDMIYRDFQAAGRAGVQNMASYGGETGDCTDCSCLCDISNWHIYVDSEPVALGIELSRTIDSITVRAVHDTVVTGLWMAVITTDDANICCPISTTEIDGTTPRNATFKEDCGNSIPPDFGSPGWQSAGATPYASVNSLAVTGSSAFDCVFHFS